MKLIKNTKDKVVVEFEGQEFLDLAKVIRAASEVYFTLSETQVFEGHTEAPSKEGVKALEDSWYAMMRQPLEE